MLGGVVRPRRRRSFLVVPVAFIAVREVTISLFRVVLGTARASPSRPARWPSSRRSSRRSPSAAAVLPLLGDDPAWVATSRCGSPSDSPWSSGAQYLYAGGRAGTTMQTERPDRTCAVKWSRSGTELLLGQIVDTNSSWIGEQLALAGINSHFQTKVGDNFDRMAAALQVALERSDAVIVCGGLGPHAGRHHPRRHRLGDGRGARARRRARGTHPRPVRRRAAASCPTTTCGRPMSRRAPRSSPRCPAPRPGSSVPSGDKVVYAVPGVPYEMQEMVSGTVIPDLRRRAGDGIGDPQSGDPHVGPFGVGAWPRCWPSASTSSTSWATPRSRSSPAASRASRSASPPRPRPTKRPTRSSTARSASLGPVLGDLVFSVDDRSMEEERHRAAALEGSTWRRPSRSPADWSRRGSPTSPVQRGLRRRRGGLRRAR